MLPSPAPNSVTTLEPSLRKGKKVYRVQLLRGRHIDRQGPLQKDTVNDKEVIRPSLRVFQASRDPNVPEKDRNPVFETVTLLNDDMKFKILNEPAPAPVDQTARRPGETLQAYLTRMSELMSTAKSRGEDQLKALDTMSLEQIREWAEAEEIDLKNPKTVEEARKNARAALKG